jgi:hypothetical protein
MRNWVGFCMVDDHPLFGDTVHLYEYGAVPPVAMENRLHAPPLQTLVVVAESVTEIVGHVQAT